MANTEGDDLNNGNQIPTTYSSSTSAWGNRNTNGSYDEDLAEEIDISFDSVDIINIDHLSSIAALPIMYDNVIDPPNEISNLCFKKRITTLTNKGASNGTMLFTVGRCYTRNYLMNGNFVSLIPIRLEPNGIMETMGTGVLKSVGKTASTVGNFISNAGSKIMNGFESGTAASALNAYEIKVVGTEYWRSVTAHMQVIMFSLGITLPDFAMRTDTTSEYTRLCRVMPEWMVQNLAHSNFNNRWGLHNSTGAAKPPRPKPTEEERQETIKKNSDVAAELITSVALPGGALFKDAAIYKDLTSGLSSIISAGTQIAGNFWDEAKATYKEGRDIHEQIKNAVADTAYKTNQALNEKLGMTMMVPTPGSDKLGTTMDVSESMNSIHNSTSIGVLRRWIMADPAQTTDSGIATLDQDLPIITFYVDGAIEKNYSVSAGVEMSQLENIAVGGAFKDGVTNALKGAGGVAQNSGNAKAAAAGAVVGYIGEMIENNTDVNKELAYGSGNDNKYFKAGIEPQVGKINTGMSSDTQYSFTIRAMADGSDKISLALNMYTLALLMPFYVEPLNNRFKGMQVPRSPILVSAFSKGVFNIPRGVIGSISIKADPVFQTTESISTDLEIDITIIPFESKGYSADYNGFWDKSDDFSIQLAMFNPLSSYNILITLCGMNSTMTTINMNLLDYFWNGTKGSISRLGSAGTGIKNAMKDWGAGVRRNSNNLKVGTF